MKLLQLSFNESEYVLESDKISLEFQTVVYGGVIRVPKKLKKLYIGTFNMTIRDTMDYEIDSTINIDDSGLIHIPSEFNYKYVLIKLRKTTEETI